MLRILIILSLIIGFQTIAQGQYKSKRASSRMAPNIHKQVKNEIDSARFYIKKDYNRSFDFIENGFKTIASNKELYKNELANLYELLGDIYSELKQYDIASNNYKLAKDYYPKTPVSLILKMIHAHISLKEIDQAETNLNTIKTSEISLPEQYDYYKLKGNLYDIQQLQNLALAVYQKGLQLATTNSNHQYQVLFNNKIAAIYSHQGAINKAEVHLKNSMDNVTIDGIPVQEEMEQVETNADFYRANNQLEEEVSLRKNSIKKLEKTKQDKAVQKEIKSQNISIADAYMNKKKYKEAIPYLEKSMKDEEKYSEGINNIDLEIQATKKLSKAYEILGNYDKALLNYRSYVKLTDQLYKTKEAEIQDAVNLSKNLADKQKRIDVLELDRALKASKDQLYIKDVNISSLNNKQQQLIIYSLLGGLLLSLLAIFFFYKNNQQRQVANNLMALKALKSQMNPHFIFNALNSVNNFISLNDERKANKYLTDFSSLMRKVLDVSDKDFTPLDEEMEMIKLYMKLEHVRFEDKFDYSIDIDSSLDMSHILIPPMLIQPYVENAVWHGMRYKEAKGNVSVLVKPDDNDNVIITISDDGVGRKKSKALKSKNQLKKKSTGMANTAKRIAIINKMYQHHIKMEITDLNEDNSGTVVRLIIPINFSERTTLAIDMSN